jgi:hypothetical protein
MARLDGPYFLVLGLLLVLAGAVSLLVGVSGTTVAFGPLVIAGPYSLWRGAVLLGAGAFFVRATGSGIASREDEALVFMGSVMIWIVGGTEILGLVLGAIPGGPTVWIASPAAFLAAVAPPYPPSILALVLTLPALRYAEDDLRTMIHRFFEGNGE